MGKQDEMSAQSLAFVEALYGQFCEDPSSVPEEWQQYFEDWAAESDVESISGRSAQTGALFTSGIKSAGSDDLKSLVLQERLDGMIRAYRVRGHVKAQLDPLGLARAGHPELEPARYGFSDSDLDKVFSTGGLHGASQATLRDIIGHLEETYCGYIGVQFMHIDDLKIKSWIQHRAESTRNRFPLSRAIQYRVLSKLTDAEMFEQFIHKKFLGAKRFSLEGGESLIPLLDLAIDEAAENGNVEAVIAMAHRGRLNVLANIMGKSPTQIFAEFADAPISSSVGMGDVKYHMGYSSEYATFSGKKIHLSLCFNPSHLEFVGPVLMGRVRAKQDRLGDTERRQVLPILIHGDAAFAGQGVVAEMLNSSELPGYSVGGTVHIIVNNQVGFTTSPESSRSTMYPSDVAKLLQIPIIHVNGEHPAAVAQAIKIAMDFRQKFQKDVVIDMWCYRLHGHNEGDDPAFTQPVMYSAIRKRKTVRESFVDNLRSLGEVTEDEAREIKADSRRRLEEGLLKVKTPDFVYELDTGKGVWAKYKGGHSRDVVQVDTAVPAPVLKEALLKQAQCPEKFTPHPKIQRLFDQRTLMANGEKGLDWGAAESLAFATLLLEGVGIRLSGQDSGRGTFGHRHSVLHDFENGDLFLPLNHLDSEQGQYEVLDSPLSEAAVLGQEFGYSLDMPERLVIWEAQFGDFANGAQVIIDQFITTTEEKWHRLSGLVMLLPHGFEGQGPEHSSARLERFLAMCADDNMQIVNLTTPAQLFHCLRRQVCRPFRKPLVVMSPKSLLRHPKAVSSLASLSDGQFEQFLVDPDEGDRSQVKRVVVCSGKVYYELVQARSDLGAEGVSIHRLEQIYPIDEQVLGELLEGYEDGTEIVWAQEEPENMGVWPYLKVRFGTEWVDGRFHVEAVARVPSASPATGSSSNHKREQKDLLQRAIQNSKTLRAVNATQAK
jgi:2-oxoglutarate dehydrogenase E1 component